MRSPGPSAAICSSMPRCTVSPAVGGGKRLGVLEDQRFVAERQRRGARLGAQHLDGGGVVGVALADEAAFLEAVGGEAGGRILAHRDHGLPAAARSEEHTSELQSLMRNSYAVFCLKKKSDHTHHESWM